MSKHSRLVFLAACLGAAGAHAEAVREAEPGRAVERHLPSDPPPTQWTLDPAALATESGDRVEKREVVVEGVKTVQLRNVVPPIRFESGVAEIPASYVERLRGVLTGMQHLENVRLHLVGHADDEPLSDALAGVFEDNAGLSRERAGEVAELLKNALGLPPGAISLEWAGDTQPIAPNTTPAGRALNRRVEVQVWYDEPASQLATQEVVVPEAFERFEVCRVETVCMLRYRDGHARRARVRNLIAPMHYGDGTVGVPDAFVAQIREALHNLRDKQGVVVKFIGFTDDVPLTGRAELIYGTHLALSKARAHRVARAVQEALALPSSAVASDGRGASQPLASNETERGRALNRRVEVELWHDDPLQELPDGPQPCPRAGEAERVTRVYDPPWGPIAPLPIEGGEARIPPGYADALRRALAEIAGRDHVRLRFVGYTKNEPLERRTAVVYGDDVGLSVSRARRTMESLQQVLALSDAQVEHEGRGYVHADEVVNAGFVQGDTSHVVVQVVYDELVPPDDLEGIEVTPLTRELTPKDPLALNVMRISVDGEPIDDPGRSSADIQRCTDVALERADIRFRFDGLATERRLSASADPSSVPIWPSGESGTVRFAMYANYHHFIERAEVRIFDQAQSLEDVPASVVDIGPDGLAEWTPPLTPFPAPKRDMKYVLRAYGAEGRFDETEPMPLWVIHSEEAPGSAPAPTTEPELDPLLGSYGESRLAIQNIPLGNVGRVQVEGSRIPPEHGVWLAGEPVPVARDGRFVAEALVPTGVHTVEVAVLDPAGNGELFLRDLALERDQWFYVGQADLTLSLNDDDDNLDELTAPDATQPLDSDADGRLAFYVDGKFREDWRLVASVDTREEPLDQMFTNFVDKSPEALLRRIDPDYYYPTFGDDSVVEETAPTLGKFYVKLANRESHALFGNFKVGYVGNELALIERGLYGGNVHYETPATTRFGEQRLSLDGFAADPGTVPSRDEFRGTGGSLYFLRNREILVGSERVRIEVRDQDSGLVKSVVHLRPSVDYQIDYLQGNVFLAQPLSPNADANLLVRNGGLSGDEAWLVVQYEFTPGLDSLDTLASGGEGHYWLNDFVRLGATANTNDQDGTDSSLYAADLTMRKSANSWFKLQAGKSEGLVSTSFLSEDGGFGFVGLAGLDPQEADAEAFRGDVSLQFADFVDGVPGTLSLYALDLGAGYTAPGSTALTDTTQYGALFRLPVTERLNLLAKSDELVQENGLETSTQQLDLGYQLTKQWNVGAGVRNDDREDHSPIVPVTQQEGQRTDAVVQIGFDSLAKWKSYGFVQETLAKSGDREDNGRVGVGGAYRFTDRFSADAEVSHGDLGPGAKLGTDYQFSDRTNAYLNYELENERTDNGLPGRGASLVTGARTRPSDSTSVYAERRQLHSSALTGLTHAAGLTLAPKDRWNLGANVDVGSLFNRQTYAETKRKAGGARIGYGFDTVQLSSGFEYRYDETEQLDGSWSDRTTWLLRSTVKYQTTPDWRVVGKVNYMDSDSSLGEFYDGGYREAVLGFAYRPVAHDRFDALAKYTYFYNVPAIDPFTLSSAGSQFVQQSQIASLDLTYDLTKSWSIGGKYAYRLGEVSLSREDRDFFDNDAHLFVLRADWRFLEDWESTLEGRVLELPNVNDRRSGAVFTVYRYLGEHFKVGVGYNFTDFSDDLTDLGYDHRGVFLNVVGTL